MKNLTKSIFLFAAIFSIGQMYAQTTVGIRGGVNMATFSENIYPNTNLLELSDEYMVGIDLAVFANFKLAYLFSLQPEIHFVQKGTRLSGTYTGIDEMDVKMTYRYNYLEMPILARIDVEGEIVNFNVFLGPSVGYGLNGKFKGENFKFGTENGVESGDFDSDLDWDDEYGTDGVKDNRFDISGVAGVGFEFGMGFGNILFDARYNFDFNDRIKYETTPDPEPDAVTSRGISLTAGVSIPIGE